MASTQPAPSGSASPLTPAPLGERFRRLPWWQKGLLGCGIGCGGLAVAAGVLFLVGVWWAFSPGAQVATDKVVPPDAVVVVHFSGQKHLEGLGELVDVFFAAVNEVQWRETRDHLPRSFRWIEPLARMQQTENGQAVGMWLPREATAAVVPGEGGTRRVVVAANLRSFVRPLRMILTHIGPFPGRVERHAGGEVVTLRRGGAVGFARGTLLWSDQASLLDDAVHRARSKSSPDRPTFLAAAEYDRWKREWSLAIVADGRDERARELFAALLERRFVSAWKGRTAGELAQSFTHLAGGVRLATADRLEAEVALAVPDAVSASGWRSLIDAFLAREAAIAQEHGLALTGTTRETASGLTVEVRLDGIADYVRRLAAEHNRGSRRPVATPVPEDEDDETPATVAGLPR